jgi:carboxyl-terminal processing protease
MLCNEKRKIRILIILLGLGFIWVGLTPHSQANEQDEIYKGLRLFSDIIDMVEKNYVDPVDGQELIEDAIQGMVHSLDPHSALLTPDVFKDLKIDTQGKFTGIGIHITMQNGFVTVIAPIEGTPAYDAGIQAQDRIVKVDGKPTRDLRDAVKRMRGPRGTHVNVTIMREGVTDPIEFSLIRDVIPIRSIKAKMIKPGYGYIWITNFTGRTVNDLEAALMKLEQEENGLKGLILDFRNNGGGLLDQAIAVTDLFLKEGTIVSIKGRHQRNNKVYRATPNKKVRRDYPLAVLINAGSASASEIVAGALQDHKRAIILGMTSFGKGSVQTVESLRDGYGLKLTIARYYTPKGRSIQAKGIEPDIEIKQRVFPEVSDTQQIATIKERDLENHLEAAPTKEPSPQNKKAITAPQPEKPQKGAPALSMPFNLDNLESDYQVMRALDILLSYQILSQTKQTAE